MATPIFKVYSREGEYLASCKYPEDAAAVVSVRGDGATIRYGHRTADVVWTEGPAGDGDGGNSYDTVAQVIQERLDARAAEQRAAGLRSALTESRVAR